jgi:hypothetical protein
MLDPCKSIIHADLLDFLNNLETSNILGDVFQKRGKLFRVSFHEYPLDEPEASPRFFSTLGVFGKKCMKRLANTC